MPNDAKISVSVKTQGGIEMVGSLSMTPVHVQDENQRAYYQQHGRPMLTDYVALELQKKVCSFFHCYFYYKIPATNLPCTYMYMCSFWVYIDSMMCNLNFPSLLLIEMFSFPPYLFPFITLLKSK